MEVEILAPVNLMERLPVTSARTELLRETMPFHQRQFHTAKNLETGHKNI